MSLFHGHNLQKQRQLHLLKLKKQMRGIQNEMEFVEILVQFWPLPNMAQKMQRLEQRLSQLQQQYGQTAHLQACVG